MLVILVSTMAFIVETIPESREAPGGCPTCEPEPVPVYALIEKVRPSVSYPNRQIAQTFTRVSLKRCESLAFASSYAEAERVSGW